LERAETENGDVRGVMVRSGDRPNHVPNLCRGFNEPSPLERAETENGDVRGVMVRIGGANAVIGDERKLPERIARRARKATGDARGVMQRMCVQLSWIRHAGESPVGVGTKPPRS
jgi:hypothetical protein